MNGFEGLPELTIDMTGAEPGPESYFIGEALIQHLVGPPPGTDFAVTAVRFATGARNRPHTHDRDQFLYYIEGDGFVHIAGADEQVVSPGTVIIVPAGVIHMHGATDAGPCLHIAIRPSGTGGAWDFDELPEGWERWLHR